MGGFWDLDVYRRALVLARDAHWCVRRWDSLDQWTAGVQLIRAADSVGANIAEAFGRNRHPDQLRLLYIARGSRCELQHRVKTAEGRELDVPDAALSRAEEQARMLNGLLRSLTKH